MAIIHAKPPGGAVAPTSDYRLFYAPAHLVRLIDEAAIAALGAFYAERLAPGAAVLDLMSNWVSHLPSKPPFGQVVGYGLNSERVGGPPALDALVGAGAKGDPRLPLPDAELDAAHVIRSRASKPSS